MKSVLAVLPVAFAAISSTQLQTFDAEHMKETFKAIAAQSGKIDANTRSNIQKILDLIEGNLTTALQDDYRIVIQEYRAQEAELEKCNADVDTCQNSYVAQQLATYQEAKEKHVDCRNFEHQVCSEKNANCTKVNDLVKSYAPPVWPARECDDACDDDGNGPVHAFMVMALQFVCDNGVGCGPEQTWSECFETVPEPTGSLPQKGCNGAARSDCTDGANGTYCECCDYASCRANCGTAKDLYGDQVMQCTAHQRSLEADHCNFLDEGCMCCANFFGCWGRKTAALEAERTRVLDVIRLIHTQQEALECLLCYGAQILEAGTTDFALCERQGCAGCGPMPFPGSQMYPTYGTTGSCRANMHGFDSVVDVSFSPTPILDESCPTTAMDATPCTKCQHDPDMSAIPYLQSESDYEAPTSESEPALSEPSSEVEPEPAVGTPESESEPSSDVEPEPAVDTPEPESEP